MKREASRVVTARFVGADGSLGYKAGQVYNLWVWSTRRAPVMIARMDNTGRCPYSSIGAFLRNWEVNGAEILAD